MRRWLGILLTAALLFWPGIVRTRAEIITLPDTVLIYDEATGRCEKMALEVYVAGVTAAEMPLSYAQEALKAQMIAARTYVVHQAHARGGGGCARYPQADACTSSECCQGFLSGKEMQVRWGDEFVEKYQRLAALSAATRGQIIVQDEVPICAMYHASSGGHTEDAQTVCARSIRYLRGVDSPGEADYPQYFHRRLFTRTSLQELLAPVKGAELNEKIPLRDFLETNAVSPTRYVESIRAGTATLTGAEFRRLLGLASAKFLMAFEDDTVEITTIGSGHGLGMSQTGADAMAHSGADCKKILLHYYAECQIVDTS